MLFLNWEASCLECIYRCIYISLSLQALSSNGLQILFHMKSCLRCANVCKKKKEILTTGDTSSGLKKLIYVYTFGVLVSHHKKLQLYNFLFYFIQYSRSSVFLSLVPLPPIRSYKCVVMMSLFLVLSCFCAASLLQRDREILFTSQGVSFSDYLKYRCYPLHHI